MYQRAYANQWIPGDGVLINLHKDFGEMLEVNPETGESKYVELKAPLEVIRNRVKALQKKGFKLVPAINLSCRKLAELGCPCCTVSASEEIQEFTDKEDNALMSHLEDMCHC